MTFICHNPALGCNSRWEGDDLNIAPGSTAIKAFRHRCSDGNTQLAISFLLSDNRVYYYYEYANPVGPRSRTKTEAGRWEQDESDTNKWRRTKSSHNGKLDKPVPTTTMQTQGTVSTQQYEEEDPCGDCSDLDPERQYYFDGLSAGAEFLFDCLANNLGYCELLCPLLLAAGPEAAPAVVGCAALVCPFIIGNVCITKGYEEFSPCVSC